MLFVFGLLDIVSALVLVLLKFGLLGKLGFIIGIYLVIKGLFFLVMKDWLSILDVFSGLFIFYVLLFGSFPLIGWVFFVWLLQKGVVSLVS
tara:strand:- start:2107 stop:2379 length:273 start_codon:yes stop_codon:yes gene_type:complete